MNEDPEKDGHSPLAALAVTPTGNEEQPGSHNKPTPPSRCSRDSKALFESNMVLPLEDAFALAGDEAEGLSHAHYTCTATSISTSGSRLPGFEVDFEPGDPDNPKNWPMWYKGLTIAALSFASWIAIFYSTSYTSGMPGMMEEFGIASQPLTILGVTAYLFGLAVGSFLVVPISEIYGRRPVYSVTLLLFTLLVIPCALATSLPEIIVVRFFG
jgi:hypothetical protein